MQIAIIGGGAAGCFAAIEIRRRMPQAHVTVFESGRRLLAKVAVTGGGRCNLTNSFEHVRSAETVYPRGARLMKRLLREFSHRDACRWFETEGVRLVTQDDDCVFPVSQDAMEIVGTLTRLMRDNGVTVKTGHRVSRIRTDGTGGGGDGAAVKFHIDFAGTDTRTERADIVLVTTGGSPKRGGLAFLDGLSLDIAEPVPSLFSVCLPGNDITRLTGTVVSDATVGLTGTKLRAQGALLITHWGMSGPAVLRLSSYAARLLHDSGYRATLAVNWLGSETESETAERIQAMAAANGKKQLQNIYPEQLNSRLWHHLLRQSGLRPDMRWSELGSKGRNRLVAVLTNDIYSVDGKNRFKEEFVTCGGVALGNVSPSTLECRTCQGLYFAGEVLDVDAVTGGFNLQAAWTMGYVAAKSIEGKNKLLNEK